jgi:hypothetical protein
MANSLKTLQNEAEHLYDLITENWKEGDIKFKWLNELIDTEIEIEKECNQ